MKLSKRLFVGTSIFTVCLPICTTVAIFVFRWAMRLMEMVDRAIFDFIIHTG